MRHPATPGPDRPCRTTASCSNPPKPSLSRYAILTPQTWPQWHGDERQGVQHLLRAVNMEPDQYQMGSTKVFVKNPESVSVCESPADRHGFRSCSQATV